MVGLFTSEIDEAIERATSELLPHAQEDLGYNLEVCDMIKGKRASAKDAMRSLKKRLGHRNPNVQMLTLKLTDACVKNAGQQFLLELASREFADTLSSLARGQVEVSAPVKTMVISYIQIWALLCRDDPGLRYIHEVYLELKRDNIPFPPPPRNIDKVILDTRAAPEWIDGNSCSRCRTAFTVTNRKHHCRNCGYVFCQDCSKKTLCLPEFGLPDPVRVCESCYVQKQEQKIQYKKSVPLPVTPPQRSPAEVSPKSEEDPDLALAIKLSLQESQRPANPVVDQRKEEEDKMLKAAIEASLKETQPPQPTRATSIPPNPTIYSPSPPPFISELDKGNVKLFSQLVDKLSLSGPSTVIEPEIVALSITMEALKNSIKAGLQESGRSSPEIAALLANLEISLSKFKVLQQMPMKQPNYYPMVQPQQATLYPTMTMHPAMIPSQPPAPSSQPNKHDQNEGNLLDDEPLIKL